MPSSSNHHNNQPVIGASFPSALRIRRSAEFERVYRLRKSVADGVLIVYVAANELDHPRLGLSVSRKVGNAVVRNRWKRLIREAFRQQRLELPAGFDYVVLPRRGAEPTAAAVFRALPSLARRAVRKLQRDAR